MRTSPVVLCLVFVLLAPFVGVAEAQSSTDQVRHTLTVDGVEREYYVRLPREYDPSREYWLLVVAHNPVRNGMDYQLARGVRAYADETGLQAIVVSPSFRPEWGVYPSLGEGDYLKAIVGEMRERYQLRDRILLAGYSFGGQVTHRFTFQNPGMVAAAAPLAAGFWTMPDGVLTTYTDGAIEDAVAYFAATDDGAADPDAARAAARAATLHADPASREIPFLVMVGTEDPRLEHTQALADRLQALGYEVETEWPRTPHSCLTRDPGTGGMVEGAECQAEFGAGFDRYAERVVDFFRRVAAR